MNKQLNTAAVQKALPATLGLAGLSLLESRPPAQRSVVMMQDA